METTFVADYDYECPYCHGQLDYTNSNDEKVCRECGRKFKNFTVEKY